MLTDSPLPAASLCPWQDPVRNRPFHLTSFLAEAAERSPERTLSVDGMELTCEQAWMRILRIATWLQENGVSRGDKVVTVLRHSPDLHLITLAAAHVGAVISVISPQTSLEQFQHILAEAEPVCLFLEKTSRQFKKLADNVLTVWMDEGLNGGGWDEADFSEVMQTRPAWGMRFSGQAEDPALLVFPESADAGQRGGVLLSHAKVRHLMNEQPAGSDGLLSFFQSAPRLVHRDTAVLEA